VIIESAISNATQHGTISLLLLKTGQKQGNVTGTRLRFGQFLKTVTRKTTKA